MNFLYDFSRLQRLALLPGEEERAREWDLVVVSVLHCSEGELAESLPALAEAVREVERGGGKAAVVLVDSGSTDRSLEVAREWAGSVPFPVFVLPHPFNVGFVCGSNEGALLFPRARYYFFLNPDAILKSNSLRLALLKADSEPDIGVLGFAHNDGSGRRRDSTQNFPLPRGLRWARRFPRLFLRQPVRVEVEDLSRWDHALERDVDVVSGATMLVRGELFRRLNGFDSSFFMYQEDKDLCLRARYLGYRVVFFPLCEADHLGQRSSRRRVFLQIVSSRESMRYFFAKHYRPPVLWFFVLSECADFLFKSFLEVWRFLRGRRSAGETGERLRAYWFLLRRFLGLAPPHPYFSSFPSLLHQHALSPFKREVRRCLLVRFSALGDICEAARVYKALKSSVPEASWRVVLGEAYRGVEVLFDGAEVLFHRREKKFGGVSELRSFLRDVLRLRGKYDVVVDLQGNRRSSLLLLLVRGRRNWRYRFSWKSGLNITEAFYFITRSAGIPCYPYALPILSEPGEEGKTEREKKVGLLVGVNWRTKRWEPGAWARLAASLAEMGWRVCLLGADSDREYADRVLEELPRGAKVEDEVGKVALEDLPAFLRRLDLAVGHDTGPYHMALALGVPTLVLFFGTSPHFIHPLASLGYSRALWGGEGIECSPCFKFYCPKEDYDCRRRITPEKALETLGELTGGRDEPSPMNP